MVTLCDPAICSGIVPMRNCAALGLSVGTLSTSIEGCIVALNSKAEMSRSNVNVIVSSSLR